MRKNIPIGQVLVEDGYLTEEKLHQALIEQKSMKGKRLGEVLLEKGYVQEMDVLRALQKRLNVRIVDLQQFQIKTEALKCVDEAFAKKNCVIPAYIEDDVLHLVTSDPLNYSLFDEIALMSGMEVLPILALKAQIEEALQKYYAQVGVKVAVDDIYSQIANKDEEIINTDYADMMGRVDNAPIVRLVNKIIEQAYTMRASDIHIEPTASTIRVRLRIDGDLLEAMTLNTSVLIALTTRIKIMSGVDIAERRLPQDGRMTIELASKPLNMRVSTLPTVYGEKIVIRLLGDTTVGTLRINELGMNSHNLAVFRRMIRNPNGIILATGPTGSGKTTTLYAIISEIMQTKTNIVTLEEPVERNIDGINQVQINIKSGMTFAFGLRAILRQDPDIIMVGEMRDGETASIAARAAITGHLVLSTLHTNNAISSFLRIIDMGVEPFMVASSIKGVIAQRLVKLICPYCKQEHTPTGEEMPFLDGMKTMTYYAGKGCSHCNFSGYLGRSAIHEVIPVDDMVRHLIMQRKPEREIKQYLQTMNTLFLKDSMLALLKEGKSTIEQMIKTTYFLD